jgi:hypothetical protein
MWQYRGCLPASSFCAVVDVNMNRRGAMICCHCTPFANMACLLLFMISAPLSIEFGHQSYINSIVGASLVTIASLL